VSGFSQEDFMTVSRWLCAGAFAGCVAFVSATVSAQGITGNKQGQGGSVVQGAAGTGGSSGDTGLQHCDKPMGAMAVVEPQDFVLASLRRYNLGSPVGLIRLMIQQSNCFIVVERGIGLQNAMQERALQNSGELRSNSNVGGGQMVTADFIMTPAVVFAENNAGGVGAGVVGGLFGRTAGAIAGGLKFKEAQTSMLVADARSTVQVAAAEGSTRKADLRLGAGLFGGGFAAAGGGYGNTNEGKIIASAFMNNYNELVLAVRNDPALQRNVGSLKDEAAKGGTTKAGAVFNEGDVLAPKIAGVVMYADASDKSKVVAKLDRGDDVVVVGEEKDGYIKVQGGSAAGWVKVILVSKR
jgi:Curli production assembly/transport component CsgG